MQFIEILDEEITDLLSGEELLQVVRLRINNKDS